MKLLSFAYGGTPSWGALAGGGVVDLRRRLGPELTGLREVLERGALPIAAEVAASNSPDYRLDEIVFLPPIPAPEKIICVGINYRDRNQESAH